MEEPISNNENSSTEFVVIKKSKLPEVLAKRSLEFDDWTSLISEIEKSLPDSLETISLAYDSFLLEFPLCTGYWRKYVNHIIRLSTIDKAVEVFERAVLSATYCVDLWVDYCDFGMICFEDPSHVRRLVKRALSFVGKNFLCHRLWDKYIEFEFSLKHWSSLADIYVQTLRFPTKKLHHYYESFKKLVEAWETEMQSCGNSSLTELVEPSLDNEASAHYNQDDIVSVIKDLLNPSIDSDRHKVLQKYKSIGELFFEEASKLNEKINFFEIRIKRPYFHVNPLDASQLENWHQYLDFAESYGNFDWAVKLYERCLIPCANYPEFWMRYVDFMECKGGREIANFALDRATQIFLKRVSVIHLFNARFKEHIGDVISARASFLQCNDGSVSDVIENVVMRSNMEKRLGNLIAASNTYKEAIDMAVKMEKWDILPILYVHFSRLKYTTTDSEDSVRDILIDGIKNVPCCKLLIEELIKFAISHGGSRHTNVVDSIVADAISPGTSVSQGLSAKEREDISRLYLEFVDLCGTLDDVRKSWNRHIKLFPLSVRTTLCRSAKATKLWKIDMEPEETVVSHTDAEPGRIELSSPILDDTEANSPARCAEPERNKPSSPILDDTGATSPATDQKVQSLSSHVMLPNQGPGQESPLLENRNELSKTAQESVSQVSLKFLEPSEDSIEPNPSFDIECQVANGIKSTPGLLELSKEDAVRKEFDHGSFKPTSLERLSLDPKDAKSPGSISPTCNDSGAPLNTSLLDGSLMKIDPPHKGSTSNENIQESGQNPDVDRRIDSPVRIQVPTSAQSNRGNVSPSSSADDQNNEQAFSQKQKLGHSGRDWHQRSNSDRYHRDSKFRFRGQSRKRHYRQRHSSPQRAYQRAERGSQVPLNRDRHSHHQFLQNPQAQQDGQVQSQYPAVDVHTNLAAAQGWSQSPVQPALYSQLQMSQNPTQSNEQLGNLQDNQAYNQLWQQYYYQQQQLLWQQQQLQPQQQQLLQQQYQQQLIQYFQQQGQQLQPQQQQLLQLQQQQLPYQQQQLQQLQEQLQQQLLLQQHSYQQQQLVYTQQQPQQQQQQQYHQLPTSSTQQHSHEQEGQPKHQSSGSQVQD